MIPRALGGIPLVGGTDWDDRKDNTASMSGVGNNMNAHMKIEKRLPLDLADKWKRLLASQGGDPEALALAAVELLWKKYGKDVEKFERGDLAYRKKLAAEYVRTVRPANRESALLGRFDRKLDAKRCLRIPSEWFSLMGEPKSVVVLADPSEKCLDIVPEATFAAEVRRLRRRAAKDASSRKELGRLECGAVHLEVRGGRAISIPAALLKFAAIKDRVALFGSIRYAKVWNPKLLSASDEMTEAEIERCLEEVKC